METQVDGRKKKKKASHKEMMTLENITSTLEILMG